MRFLTICQAHIQAKWQGGNLGVKILLFILLALILFYIYLLNYNKCINLSRHTTRKWTLEHNSMKELKMLQKAPYCYELSQEDSDVSNLPDYKVLPNSIFFLETSCHHGAGINLTVRQACAFESAARAHPNSEILVLFPSAISLQSPSLLVSRLLEYPNIKLLRVDMDRYFANTPLEGFEMRRVAQSKWPETHASDVLRVLTLWKYGGTYFDADFIVLRPVNMMANFAAAQSLELVNNAVMNFNIGDEGGKKIINEMILEVRDQYLPNDWGHIGPTVISRVLRRICNETDIQKMTPEKCKGFTVFAPPPASPFYRLPPGMWKTYFNESISQAELDRLGESYALHTWNFLSKGTSVKLGSRMPFGVFASKYCPRVYSTVVDYF